MIRLHVDILDLQDNNVYILYIYICYVYIYIYDYVYMYITLYIIYVYIYIYIYQMIYQRCEHMWQCLIHQC